MITHSMLWLEFRQAWLSSLHGLASGSMLFVYICLYRPLTPSNRLARIRKVGLSSNYPRSGKSRKPWLPLPLRKRSLDGWSWSRTKVRSMTPPFNWLLYTNRRGLRLMSWHVMAWVGGIGNIRLETFGVVSTRFNCSSIPVSGLSRSVFVRTDEDSFRIIHYVGWRYMKFNLIYHAHNIMSSSAHKTSIPGRRHLSHGLLLALLLPFHFLEYKKTSSD